MLLSCIGTGFGIFFFMVAFITDNSKKTGSKYFPSTLVIFIGGKVMYPLVEAFSKCFV